jgi:hypothetical protein
VRQVPGDSEVAFWNLHHSAIVASSEKSRAENAAVAQSQALAVADWPQGGVVEGPRSNVSLRILSLIPAFSQRICSGEKYHLAAGLLARDATKSGVGSLEKQL